MPDRSRSSRRVAVAEGIAIVGSRAPTLLNLSDLVKNRDFDRTGVNRALLKTSGDLPIAESGRQDFGTIQRRKRNM